MDSQAKYGSVARGAGDLYLRLPVSKDYQEKISMGDLPMTRQQYRYVYHVELLFVYLDRLPYDKRLK